MSDFGPELTAILNPPRVAPLGPGRPNEAFRSRLSRLTPELVVAPHRLVDRSMAECCLAGLWLYHDFLDESHAISQSIDTPSGSYWHAIMHRREPDAGNAKYWFKRVGRHAVFGPLSEAAAQVVRSSGLTNEPRLRFLIDERDSWDAVAWVELCDEVRRVGGPPSGESTRVLVDVCAEIAQNEWRLLLDHCWSSAVGVFPNPK